MKEPSSMLQARLLVIGDDHARLSQLLTTPEPKPKKGVLGHLRSALSLQQAPPADEIQFTVDSVNGWIESIALIRSAKDENRPYAVAVVNLASTQGQENVHTIESIADADPELQIIFCCNPAGAFGDDAAPKLARKDALLIVGKPLRTAEILQAVHVLTAKWFLGRDVRTEMGGYSKRMYERTVALRRTNEELRAEIAQRAAIEAKLRHNAFHDALTNLSNRALLMDRVSQCLKRVKRNASFTSAVLFLDIDNFKIINDSLGHQVGDQLLIEVAQRIVSCLRSFDTVARPADSTTARLGGDEFVILLECIKANQDALILAERIQQRLAPPFQLSGQDVAVTASIGIAFVDANASDAHEVLRNADSAMYRAKHTGKARQAVYDESMHVEAKARLDLENDLRYAQEKNEVEVFYQPIVSLRTGNITAFEALMRWNHPRREFISPAEFIPVAEETGLIVPLGYWILREACQQLALWNKRRSPSRALSIGVNVSKRQLMEADFCENVAEIIREAGVESKWVNLEVTESAIITGSEPIEKRVLQLKELGVRLQMDDFGTGYSSLSSLHRFPFDVLKIDRAFVMDLETRKDYAAIIRAIISLARHLDLKVTAEGVETEEQFAQIVALDCDFAQGYLISKPINSKSATALISSNPTWRAGVRKTSIGAPDPSTEAMSPA